MKKNCFTLGELAAIVVIAVLGISMVMPLLQAAQDEAKNTGCIAKLRQYGAALAAYAKDNQDWLISTNVYSPDKECGTNNLINNYSSSKARSGRIVLLHGGYFGEVIKTKNGAEQLAARKRFYQCPDDTKVFDSKRDSYYLMYYTPGWCSYSYRFGAKNYAREKLNGIGHLGGLVAADAGIYEGDKKNGWVIHEEYTNALTLGGTVTERPTALAITQPSILKALRFGDGYGCLDVRE